MPRPQTSLRLSDEDRVLFEQLMKYLRKEHSTTNFNAAVMWAVRKVLDGLKLMPSAAEIKRAVTRLRKDES
jgi:hypothetical protein